MPSVPRPASRARRARSPAAKVAGLPAGVDARAAWPCSSVSLVGERLGLVVGDVRLAARSGSASTTIGSARRPRPRSRSCSATPRGRGRCPLDPLTMPTPSAVATIVGLDGLAAVVALEGGEPGRAGRRRAVKRERRRRAVEERRRPRRAGGSGSASVRLEVERGLDGGLLVERQAELAGGDLVGAAPAVRISTFVVGVLVGRRSATAGGQLVLVEPDRRPGRRARRCGGTLCRGARSRWPRQRAAGRRRGRGCRPRGRAGPGRRIHPPWHVRASGTRFTAVGRCGSVTMCRHDAPCHDGARHVLTTRRSGSR